eukprot:jgi/Picsp_1/2277/NSC_05741-R1_---NA---
MIALYLFVALLVVPSRAQVSLDNQGCQVRTNDWNKDYKFDAYKKETGAAFSNFEIRALRAAIGVDGTIKVLSNVGNVRKCFKSCVNTKECHTFTYVAKTQKCTLSADRALASDKTTDKPLAQFCRKKGSVAGYIGYNPGNSENKQEKVDCVDPIDTCTKQCCSGASGTCNIKKITCTSKGLVCTC